MLSLLFVLLNKSFSQTINDSCQTSLPFCTGFTYCYPAGTNSGTGQVGPDYTCLYTQPNPAWYYMQIDQPGQININIQSTPGQYDVDFTCWGPFSDPITPCSTNLTSSNTVDCSYSTSFQETCNIPNAQIGEYYIFIITNYSNQTTNITFNQTNAGQPGAGSTICGTVANFSGSFYFDSNNNSVRDSNEVGMPNSMVKVPLCGVYFMDDTLGNYNAYLCSAPDTIWPYFYYSTYSTINPPYRVVNSSSSNVDFGIYLIPNIVDLSTTLTNAFNAVPGFDFNNFITINNFGTTNSCGSLTLQFDSMFSFVSSNPPADSVSNNTVYWNNVCVNIFQSSNFNIIFHVDTSAVVGTSFEFSSTLTNTNDTNVTNNNDYNTGIFVSSYDPNNKEVVPSGIIDNSIASAQEEFIYTVRFQNTGNAPATTVKIVDTLSNWLQIPTFLKLSSSHQCTYNISEFGILTITFNNINLPDSSSNEIGSHGFIKFSLKCKPELANGGDVYNTAHIYFDYNSPIVTNTVVTSTKIVTYLNPVKKTEQKQISAKPNPATDFVNVNILNNEKSNLLLEITNNEGKIVKQQVVLNNERNINVDISNLISGSYIIHVFGNHYNQSIPIIKK